MVILLSDHGQHFIVGHLPILPDDSRLEENYLPFLIHLVPSDIPAENLAFLEKNQQSFVNAHDIYASLKSIAMGRKAGSEIVPNHSYFYEEVPRGRDCDKNTEGVDYLACWCSNDPKFVQKQLDKRFYFYVEF